MLVLTRQVGEEIVIDGKIRVRVLSLTRGRVILGVTAPEEVDVHREEVHRYLQVNWRSEEPEPREFATAG